MVRFHVMHIGIGSSPIGWTWSSQGNMKVSKTPLKAEAKQNAFKYYNNRV